MRKLLVSTALLILGFAYPALAANNSADIPVMANIPTMQALGAASSQYSTVYVKSYTSGFLGGGIFAWDATNTTAGDSCNIFTATGVSTGRWIRQVPAGTQGVPVANCGGIPDFGSGNTDNITAVNAALAVAAAEAGNSGNTNIVFGPGHWGINSHLTLDSGTTGMDLNGGTLRFDNSPTTGDVIHFQSSDPSNVFQNTTTVLQNGWMIGPGQATAANCLSFYDTRVGAGAVAHIRVKDFYAAGCGVGTLIGTNAYIINFSHVTVAFNGVNVSLPSGTSNSGENISFTDGSTIADATSFGIDDINPTADLNLTDTSVDFNNSGSNCQINVDSSAVKIKGGHAEASGQILLCVANSTGTPSVELDHLSIVSTGASVAGLINAPSGSYVSVIGGKIYANGTPTITVQSGGSLYLAGMDVGGAAFNGGNGNYTYCPVLGSCQTNQTQRMEALQISGYQFCSTSLTISSTGVNTALATTLPGLVLFNDGTNEALVSFTASGRNAVFNDIANFQPGWSGGPVVQITSGGTVPRTIKYCQIGLQ